MDQEHALEQHNLFAENFGIPKIALRDLFLSIPFE